MKIGVWSQNKSICKAAYNIHCIYIYIYHQINHCNIYYSFCQYFCNNANTGSVRPELYKASATFLNKHNIDIIHVLLTVSTLDRKNRNIPDSGDILQLQYRHDHKYLPKIISCPCL
jgi:hypothetical protein